MVVIYSCVHFCNLGHGCFFAFGKKTILIYFVMSGSLEWQGKVNVGFQHFTMYAVEVISLRILVLCRFVA